MSALRKLIPEFVKNSSIITPLRWYANAVSRDQLIQLAIEQLDVRRYLEIGVDKGNCFSKLRVAEKIGVDPVAASPKVIEALRSPGAYYFQMESDLFFGTVAPQRLSGGLDLAFIDGLHTYEQAYRDIMNTLKYLTPRGLIFVHDCLPTSESEARPLQENASNHDAEAYWTGAWTGDVWKAIVRLRSEAKDLRTNVLNTDHGVGVIRRETNDAPLNCSLDEIDKMTFTNLSTDRVRLLGLTSPRHIHSILGERRSLV